MINAFYTVRKENSLLPADCTLVKRYGYVPDGFTADSWAALKKKEQPPKKINLGMSKFKSQTLDEYMTSGRAKLYPISKEEVDRAFAEGRPQDVPYMQRPGGK